MTSVPPPSSVVVVGAGLAASQTVQALREQGYSGRLTLLGAEPHLPYDRPPLSKAVLLGEEDTTDLAVDYAALDVEVRTGVRALGLNADGVETDAGQVAAGSVVVATGATPVRLPGTEGHPHVHVLRSLDDSLRLRAALQPDARVVVVGAGWIGAEVATAARRRGCAVTVVEAAPAPLAVALGPVGAATAPWYAEAGVDLRTDARVATVGDDGIRLDDGTHLPADVVVVGIGVRPATSWLDGTGVDVDRGVLVDERCRSSRPGVLAVGDAAAWWSPRFAARLRVEHWDDALHAPAVAASTLLGGDLVHDPVPYFWSEQFGRMVQFAGHVAPVDRLLWRGASDEATWSACWLAPDGRLQAVLTVGRPRDLLQGRRLIASGEQPDPGLLADPGIAIKDTV